MSLKLDSNFLLYSSMCCKNFMNTGSFVSAKYYAGAVPKLKIVSPVLNKRVLWEDSSAQVGLIAVNCGVQTSIIWRNVNADSFAAALLGKHINYRAPSSPRFCQLSTPRPAEIALITPLHVSSLLCTAPNLKFKN